MAHSLVRRKHRQYQGHRETQNMVPKYKKLTVFLGGGGDIIQKTGSKEISSKLVIITTIIITTVYGVLTLLQVLC